MTEKEKWYELGYKFEIDSLESRKDLVLRSPRHVEKSQLNCYDACIRLSELEAEWNWYNYWPLSKLDGYETLRTPEQVKFDIRTGKRVELLFALQHKAEIKQMPTMYSIEHNEEYDMIFNNGDKYEIKTSKKRAEDHKQKYPNVKVAYPEDSSNLNEKSKYIII